MMLNNNMIFVSLVPEQELEEASGGGRRYR